MDLALVMSNIKNPVGFWGGVVAVGGGAIFLYLAADFGNTNLNTYFYPELIKAGLFIIGVTLVAVGIIKIIMGYFVSSPSSSSNQ